MSNLRKISDELCVALINNWLGSVEWFYSAESEVNHLTQQLMSDSTKNLSWAVDVPLKALRLYAKNIVSEGLVSFEFSGKIISQPADLLNIPEESLYV